MVPFHRSQSRVLKPSGSRSLIRLTDASSALRYILWCLGQALLKLWNLNPISLLLRRWRQLHYMNTRMALRIRPRIIDLTTDFFLSDERRKRKLLSWVKSLLPWIGEEVFDFTACWQDGIVLCALMESISPGTCPRFSLLKPHHRVNNCRLGIQLAMRYLSVSELPLSPEEMAIADEDSEVNICHLVQLLKWKYQKQGSKPTVFSGADAEQPIECKCQARGTGIRTGIVGKRTKFNILMETVARLDLEIEIRGPNNEYNKEKIISLNPGATARYRDNRKAAVLASADEDGKTKVIDDGAGHSYLRQKSLDDDMGHLIIPFDYQCVGEGRFLVTYIPRSAGAHNITILSGGVHIQGSPFEVKVSDWVSSWNLLPKSRAVPFDMLQSIDEQPTDPQQKSTVRIMRKLTHVAQVSKQLTRMKRRILRKVITPSGEEIICDMTPTMSRQNSGDSEMSEDDRRRKADSGSHKYSEKAAIQNKSALSSRESSTYSGHNKTSGSLLRPDDKSASPKSPTSPGATFAATVLAAKAAAAGSSNKPSKSGTSDTTTVTNRMTESASKKLSQGQSMTEHLEIDQRSTDESPTPDIVITQDADLIASDIFFTKIKQDHARNNRTIKNTRANTDTSQFIESCSETKPSFSSTQAGTRSQGSSRRYSVGGNFISEGSNNKTLGQFRGSLSPGLPSSSAQSGSKSLPPFLKVSDVVGSVLSNLKQEKLCHAVPVSPAHRHYLRSFSLDETHHQLHPTKTSPGNIDHKLSIPPPSHSPAEPSVGSEEDSKNHFSTPKSSTNSTSFTSFNKPHAYSQEYQKQSSSANSELNDGTMGTENGAKIKDQCFHEIKHGTGNSFHGQSHFEAQENDQDKSNSKPTHAYSYCPVYGPEAQEPVIKKLDLDKRVYEIIEETSERDNDSVHLQEGSLDGAVSSDVNDFSFDTNETTQSRYFQSMKDLDGSTRPRLRGASLSFDNSQSELNDKTAGSQPKRFSIEQKLRRSLSCPYEGEGEIFGEINSDVAPVIFPGASFIRYVRTSDKDSGNKSDDESEQTSGSNALPEDTPFPSKRRNSKYLPRKRNWTQTRSMSFPDSDAADYINHTRSHFDAFGFKRRPRRDHLLTMRKWNTFDGESTDIRSLNNTEVLMPMKQYLVNGNTGNRDFNTKDDELKTVMKKTACSNRNKNDAVNEESHIPALIDYESIEASPSGKTIKRCLTPSANKFPPVDNDRFFNTTIEQADEGLLASPSSLSNKSDNSDWSDNENNPPTISTNHVLGASRQYLKGDWSPQFVDLNYHGDDRFSTEALQQTDVKISSSNKTFQDCSPESHRGSKQPTIAELNVKSEICSEHFQAEDPCSSRSSKEHFPVVETSSKLRRPHKIISPTSPTLLMESSGQCKFKYSQPEPFKNCEPNEHVCYLKQRNKPFLEKVSPGDNDHSESEIYLKRRYKPIYEFSGRNNNTPCQADNTIWANSRNSFVVCKEHCLDTTEYCNGLNGKIELPYLNTDDNRPFFSALELLSPEYSYQLQTSRKNSYNNFVPDVNVCLLCQEMNVDVNSKEDLSQQKNYFRERTLTPTKFRLKKNIHHKHLRTTETHLEGHKFIPEKASTAPNFTENEAMHWECSASDLNSIMAIFSPGDRLLTPTKYKRHRSFQENCGDICVNSSNICELKELSLHARNTTFHHRRDSAVQTSELVEPAKIKSEAHRIRKVNIQKENNESTLKNSENLCKLCDKGLATISQEEDSGRVSRCANGSKSGISGFYENELWQYNQIHSHYSKDSIRQKQLNTEDHDFHYTRHSISPPNCDHPADDIGLKPYLKRRRRVVGRETANTETSTGNSCYSFNDQNIGNPVNEQHMNFGQQAARVNRPPFSERTANQPRSTQHNHLPQVQRQYHMQDEVDCKQLNQQTSPQICCTSYPHNPQQHFNHVNHHQQQHRSWTQQNMEQCYIYGPHYQPHDRAQIHHENGLRMYHGVSHPEHHMTEVQQRPCSHPLLQPQLDQELYPSQIEHQQFRHSLQDFYHHDHYHHTDLLQQPSNSQQPRPPEHRHAGPGGANGEDALRRQSSLDTLDSGITEDSSHCPAPTSSSDATDCKPVS